MRRKGEGLCFRFQKMIDGFWISGVLAVQNPWKLQNLKIRNPRILETIRSQKPPRDVRNLDFRVSNYESSLKMKTLTSYKKKKITENNM